MKSSRALAAQARRDGLRINAGLEQRLVGVDVAHPADELLVHEERLDHRPALAKHRPELRQLNGQRIRTQRANTLRQFLAPLDPSEMPDIVVNKQSFVEFKQRPGIRARGRIEQQLTRHAQMNRERAVVQIEHDELAVPPNPANRLPAKPARQLREILLHHELREKFGAHNPPAWKPRRKRSHDGFNFGKLRQVFFCTTRPPSGGYHKSMRSIFLCVIFCLLPVLAIADPPMTTLTIEVTDQAGKPVDRAGVIVKFVKGRSVVKLGKSIKKSWEMRTSQEGRVTLPPLPQGTILVQVIAKNYQTFGDNFDVDEPKKTISIKLNPPQTQYSAHEK